MRVNHPKQDWWNINSQGLVQLEIGNKLQEAGADKKEERERQCSCTYHICKTHIDKSDLQRSTVTKIWSGNPTNQLWHHSRLVTRYTKVQKKTPPTPRYIPPATTKHPLKFPKTVHKKKKKTMKTSRTLTLPHTTPISRMKQQIMGECTETIQREIPPYRRKGDTTRSRNGGRLW